LAQAQSSELGAGISTIQRIRNRGNLMVVGVAYDYAPFSLLDDEGNVIGFEPELVRALADIWEIEVTFLPVTPAARLPKLLAGQVDLIAAALPHTVENEAVVDFSSHYFTDTYALLLAVDSPSLNFGTLTGRTVAMVQDEDALAQLDEYLLTTDSSVTLLPFQEPDAALRALAAGQANTLLDRYTYLTDVAADQSDLSIIVPLAGQQAFAFGIAPGDSIFRNLVDATLQQLYQSGRYAEIYQKWFPAQSVPSLPRLPGRWPYTMADTPATIGPSGETVLEQLRARGTLRTGVRYDMPPFGFLDAEGTIQGFEVDLIHEIANRWFGDPNAVILVRVTPDTAIPLLNNEQIDLVASALTHNWPSEALVDFTLPYYADTLSLLVRRESTLTTFAELDAKTIATADGIAMRIHIATLLDPIAQPLLMPFQEYRTAEQALLAGQIDGIIGSTTALAETAAANSALRLLPETISAQSYSIALPTFNDDLRDQLNLTLQAMQLDGTYAAIYGNWFETPTFTIPTWPGISVDRPLLLRTEEDEEPLHLQPTPSLALSTTVLSVQATGAPTITTSPTASPATILVPTTLPAEEAGTDERVTPAPIGATASTASTGEGEQPITVTVLRDVNINARTEPTIDAPILTLIEGGSSLSAFALSEDGEWVAIALSSGERGWVARRFLIEAAQLGEITRDGLTATPTTIAATQNSSRAPTAASAPPTIHRISSTDSLASIAQQYYGEQRLWTLIYEANRAQIGENPGIIPLGIELVIPARP